MYCNSYCLTGYGYAIIQPMATVNFAWILYTSAALLELGLLTLKPGRLTRVAIGVFALLLLSSSHTILLLNKPVIFGIGFFVVGLYRQLNMGRLVYGRMHKAYLYQVVTRTSLVLGFMQALIAATLLVDNRSLQLSIYVLGVLSMLTAFSAVVILLSSFKKSTFSVSSTNDKDSKSLPTLTVAIPARNETVGLQACLDSFTVSTYQKLEILVLDDCSQDNSSDIIKKYAHDGVRFIKGSEPDDTWLPKNAAYQKLLYEASGDIVLFCGVDIRVTPETLTLLVSHYLSSQVKMLSVMPRRSASAPPNTTMQLLRYYWELALPRQLTKRPPVLSTMWIADTSLLRTCGGFAGVKRMIIPEAYFSRYFAKTGQYSFVIANNMLDIYSTKQQSEQRNTAVRSRYPQLHKRPEMVLIVFVIELLVVGSPLFILRYAIYSHLLILTSLAATALLLYALSGTMLVYKITTAGRFKGLLQALALLPTDLWLLNYSMYKYEFSTVEWKERNVCLPVMHVTSSLPRLQ